MTLLRSLSADLVSAASALARRAACLLLFVGAWLVLVPPCPGGSVIFEETGSMGSGRYSHTATLLPSGKVLVAGGRTGFPNGTIIASAELYDPASGTWTSTGSLAHARQQHTATMLPNGKVLVAGGVNAMASAELYDPASGTWTDSGNLVTARAAHTATLLPNGTVLVAGNYILSSGASAELYDPGSGTWTGTSSMLNVRFGPTATLLPNGNVLVVGGVSGGGSGAPESAEIYDPGSGTWTATGSLGTGRYDHSLTVLPNGKVLVAGGYRSGGALASAELYDPVSGTWRATGSLGTGRWNHTATLLSNGTVLVAGGDGDGFSTSAQLYDPATEIWTSTGSTIAPRLGHTATLLPNGYVLVAGSFGSACSCAVASAELYGGHPTPPILLNISTRLRVQTGDNVLIGGFIITGTDPKNVLIRGIGYSLTSIGITGSLVLADPTLELHQGSTTIATNDNWKTRPDGASQQAEIEATTLAPTNNFESAILVTLSPGAYTAILAGKNGGTGIGVVEAYDLAPTANSTLANISSRGFVDNGDNVMIGGFVVAGGTAGGMARVMVRALGPSVPITGALGDPTLELHDASGTLVAANDNWKTRPDGSSQQAEIEATNIPPGNDLESALVQTFLTGSYTVIVRGTNNATGVGLVEVYHLQ